MPADDPWLWTVDDLIAEVCYSDALFRVAGYSATHSPDIAMLERQIRSRQLTGEAFLTTLDKSLLVERNEFDIPRRRQRFALVSVIELLRRRSYMYKQHATTVGVDSLEINSAEYSPSARSSGVSNDAAVTDEVGRKRRKITHLSTAPLRTAHPTSRSQQPSNTAANRASDPVISNTDDYSHLLKWQNVVGGDQVVDLPDEDDLQEEDNFGLGDIAEEDLQLAEDQNDDPIEEPHERTKLSQDEIVDIINERIEFYTNAWRPNKGVARGEEVDYDPVTMWNEAEAKGEREALMHKYETDHAYYSQRLDKLCDEILKFPGSNAVSNHSPLYV
jgi:hypothetical protein